MPLREEGAKEEGAVFQNYQIFSTLSKMAKIKSCEKYIFFVEIYSIFTKISEICMSRLCVGILTLAFNLNSKDLTGKICIDHIFWTMQNCGIP